MCIFNVTIIKLKAPDLVILKVNSCMSDKGLFKSCLKGLPSKNNALMLDIIITMQTLINMHAKCYLINNWKKIQLFSLNPIPISIKLN